eukprot:scaffold123173_cov27-Phaeocystis_antarctica.AAC.1
MADADESGTINDRDELAMLLSYLNLEPSRACARKLNELLKQSLNNFWNPPGIHFNFFDPSLPDFFGWLKDCLPEGH